MPVDHRRINGPENSEPYQLFVNTRRIETLSDGRSDGRKPNELRKICMEI